jgi:CHASE3 domain sensor protein
VNPLKKISALGARFAALGIGMRLGVAFAIVLVLAAIVGATSVVALTTVRNASNALSRTWMPLIATTAALRASALEVRELEVKHSKAADAGYMGEYEDKLKELLPNVDKLAGQYGDLALGEQERTLVGAATKSWGEYLAMHRKVLSLGRGGKAEDARDVSDGAAKVALDETLVALDKLSAHAFAQGQAADASAESVFGMARLGPAHGDRAGSGHHALAVAPARWRAGRRSRGGARRGAWRPQHADRAAAG